jgi:hypothetical protein
MYLRRSTQRSGARQRVYVSIAHNLWFPRDEGESVRRGAKPFRLLQLGEISQMDWARAQVLMHVLRDIFPAPPRSEALAWVENVSAKLRTKTSFFRELVAPRPAPATRESLALLYHHMTAEILRNLSGMPRSPSLQEIADAPSSSFATWEGQLETES